MKNVFISYSHKDEGWKDLLKPHLKLLENANYCITVWDDRKIDAGEKWYPEIELAMHNSCAAILLISADYLASSFCIKDEVPYLLKRQEEDGMLLVPVLIRTCLWKAHRWLASRQMLPRDGKCVAIEYPGDKADAVFSEVAEKVFAHIENLTIEPVNTLPVVELTRSAAPVSKSTDLFRGFALPATIATSCNVDLSRLPETGKELFGRDELLNMLDEVWAKGDMSDAPRPRILGFIAQGGVGKSSLVNHWLKDMERDNYRGAAKVFGWSFYSQGARSEGFASGDLFINAALQFFGGEEGKKLANSPASAWDKGEQLAKYIAAGRNLLILDGLEPLQSPLSIERGKLRDPAVETLLRCLARESQGLCIVTSREPLFDLADLPGAVSHDINQITPQAGRALLRAARVVGTDAELEKLAEKFGPHALTISLLGVYLYEIDPSHSVNGAKALEKFPGSPLEKVLGGFELWLGESAEVEIT